MGFLDGLIQGAGNLASRAYDQVNPFDNGLSAKTRTATTNNNVLTQAMTSKPLQAYGSLGQSFNEGLRAAPASVYHTGALVADVGRLFGNTLTGNSPAIQSGLARYRNDYAQSIPNGFTDTGLKGIHMLENTGFLGETPEQKLNRRAMGIQQDLLSKGYSPDQAQQQADQSRLSGYNDIFRRTGIGRDDSGATVFRKAASNFGQNYLNLATLGSAAEKTALKGVAAGNTPSLLENLAQRAAKANRTALINTGASVAGALGQDNVSAGNLVKSAAQGYAGGLAFDVAGQAFHGLKPVVQDAITPKFAGLPKDKIIMNLDQLGQLKATSEMLKHQYHGDPEQQYTPTTEILNQSNKALHAIKDQYGHDFISGSPAERSTRIDKFVEQNGEAVPLYQQALAKKQVAQDGGYMGGKSRDQRIQEELAKAQPLNEAAALKPLELPVPASTKAQDNRSVSSTGSIAPKEKLSRFANKTVQNSDEVSAPLKKLVKDEKVTYVPTTNKGRLAESAGFLKGKTTDKAYAEVIKSFENGAKTTDQHVVNAIETAKKLDASGKEGDLFKATEIYDNISRHLTKKGQEIQAASLLNNRTPEGLKYSAQKALRKAGVEPTPEVIKAIKSYTDEIRKTEVGTDARDVAVKKLQQYVGKQIPSSATDKALGVWKAGLLTGAKTITGNALSNGTFGILHDISKPLSVGLDKAVSLVTGERKSALTYRKRVSGTAEGFSKAWGKDGFMWTGIDERQGVSNKFLENGGKQVNYKNKAVDTYVNGVFRNMAAQDRPFYYSQLRNSTYELAVTDGINKGLKGKALKNHAEEVFSKPPIDLIQTAKNEADQAVLANKTALSSIASGARKGIDSMEKGVGKSVLKVGLETTAPFTGVPSAFLSRVVDFTPAGALKEIGDQIYHKKFDQRALTTALSEATTGTAIMWLGSTLAKNNMLSGAYPTDPKEQARWKAEGITPNGIKVGGKWISANYLGPTGMLLNAGARAHDASSKGGNAVDQITQAAGGVPKDLTQQSFLQGVNNAVSAVNDPGRYLNNYINSQAGSIVPTLVNDVGSATDPYLRDKNSPLDAIKSRLPGVRTSLPISNDVFGNQLKATSNPIDRMINPLRPSTERTSPVLDEVNRLHTKDLNVMPVPVAKKLSFDGEKVNLSNEKRKELQIQLGQGVQSEWNKAIETPEYRALTDEGKKNMLDDIYKKVSEGEKYKFTQSNSLGQFSPTYTGKGNKLSPDAKSYVNGGLDLNRFAKEPNAKTALGTPAQKYQSALDQYTIDKKNGDISSVQDIARQNTLAGLKFNSTQNPDIIALHSLPKADVYKYLSTASNGSDLAKQLLAYDQAATAAGVQSTSKFTDSKGNVSIQPKAKRLAGAGRSGTRRGSRPSITTNRRFSTAKVKKSSFAVKSSGSRLASFKKPSSKTVAASKKRLRSTFA